MALGPAPADGEESQWVAKYVSPTLFRGSTSFSLTKNVWAGLPWILEPFVPEPELKDNGWMGLPRMKKGLNQPSQLSLLLPRTGCRNNPEKGGKGGMQSNGVG